MIKSPLDLTIEGRAKHVHDVQRNFMWQLWIPQVFRMAPMSLTTVEDLIIRCRGVSIPSRQTREVSTDFLGMKQHFPGKPEFNGKVTVEFEETENLKISSCFYEWNERIFRSNPLKDRSPREHSRKRNLSTKIYLSLLSYHGLPNLLPYPRVLVFHNAWPQNISEVSLTYSSSDSVKYNVTFQYDYWTLEPDIMK
ncbi:MAG: hypothetical protein ACOCZ5_00185 [bacterium]